MSRTADLTRYTRGVVEDWMRWVGWGELVGCGTCSVWGKMAACWGKAECHGLMAGCGCLGCEAREDQDATWLRHLLKTF